MNLVLILLTLVVLTASGVYVIMQDRHAAPNRLFAFFALSMIVLACAAAVRLTSRNPQEVWFVSGLLAPLLTASSWLLIWLILALFIPHRYAQPSVRWMLAAPYLLMMTLLILDWYGGFGIVWGDVVRS
ncbi:MAG: histidine kinase, partial [Roseiflexaceae bacterium]|nr:histidine kinase [Roseiflexaceae bacterium]